MSSTNKKVDDFLLDIQVTFPDRFEIIKEIREMFHRENSALAEDIKYGGLVFNLSSQLVAGIFSYKNHVSIEFGFGAEFPDPSGLLEGKGKKRRHLKIVEQQDVKNKNVSFFVGEAVKDKYR